MFLLKSLELKREIETFRTQMDNLSKNRKLTEPILADMGQKLDLKIRELQKIIKVVDELSSKNMVS